MWYSIKPPGCPTVKYDPVDYKTDITRLIPKEWIMKLKLDHEMDFEMCSVADLTRESTSMSQHTSALIPDRPHSPDRASLPDLSRRMELRRQELERSRSIWNTVGTWIR